MKKFNALFMALLLILSIVPLAFADQGEGAGASGSGQSGTTTDAVEASETETTDTTVSEATTSEATATTTEEAVEEVPLETESEQAVADYVDTELSATTSTDTCVDRIKQRHPKFFDDVGEDKVEKICRWRLWLKTHPRIVKAVAKEIKQEKRIRVAEVDRKSVV